MAITLIDSYKGQQTDFAAGMVEVFARQNAAVSGVPVYLTNDKLQHSYQREVSLGTTAIRDINATYTASNSEYETITAQMKVIGGKYTIDRVIDSENERMRQAIAKAKSAAGTIQKYFIDGLASDNEFDGLNQLCTDLSQIQTLGSGSGLAVFASAANSETFLTAVRDMENEVTGDVNDPANIGGLAYFMSRKMHAVIDRALSFSGTVQLTQKESAFGYVPHINNIPILYITKDSSNTEILGFDETVGAKNDCGSMYLCYLDELSGLTWVSPGGEFAEILAGSTMPSEVVNNGENRDYIFELILGLAAKRSDCVYRLAGIRNATS